jgi:hypothetical protein
MKLFAAKKEIEIETRQDRKKKQNFQPTLFILKKTNIYCKTITQLTPQEGSAFQLLKHDLIIKSE